MGFFDALFGRPRLKRPDMDRLFALPAAGQTLEGEAGLRPAGRAGLCVKAVDSGAFAAAEGELRELATLAVKDFAAGVDVSADELGYRWIVFRDAQLDELANLVHLMGTTLQDKGFGEQLLAAVFRFDAGSPAADRHGQPFYLIYNYKRGTFYPFAPGSAGEDDEARDEALEFRTSAVLGRDIPVEKDVERWFPLWHCPV